MIVEQNKIISINQQNNPIPQVHKENEESKPNSNYSTESSNEANHIKQKYIFENNNKSYVVNLYLNEEKIKIRINLIQKDYEDNFYEKDITQEELKKNNNVFKLCNDLEDSYEYLNYLFSDKQNQLIVKEENNLIKLEKKIKLSPPLRLEIPQKNKIQEGVRDPNFTFYEKNKNKENNENKNGLNQKNKDKNNINNNFINKDIITVKIIDNNEAQDSDINMNINLEKIKLKDKKVKFNLNNEFKKNKFKDKDKMDIIELSEEQDEKEEKLVNSHNNLICISRIKSVPTLEKVKYDNLLLNKKRMSKSNVNSSEDSDNSMNNVNTFSSNNNLHCSKKFKNNLETKNFLKIFNDDNNIKSDKLCGKFFTRIQKNLEQEKLKAQELKANLEGNINLNQENINNINNNNNLDINIQNKKQDDDEEDLLYEKQISYDGIIDDIEFFSSKSNKSPIMTPSSYNNLLYLGNNNINNNNNQGIKSNIEKNNSLSRNSSTYSLSKGMQKIQLKDSDNKININMNVNKISDMNNIIFNYNKNNYKQSKFKNNLIKNDDMDVDNPNDWNVNYSYNFIGSLVDNNNNSINKQMKPIKQDKTYKIIHKNNKTELCSTEYLWNSNHNDINNLNNSFSIESSIISGYREFDFIFNYLKIKFNKEIQDGIRIYQATIDGSSAGDFHRLCDGNTNLVVLIKTTDGKKIGGYTSIGFNSFNRSYHDDTAFIFSIDKREIYPVIKGKNAVDSFFNLGPCFSGDSLKIFDNFLQIGGVTTKDSENFEFNELYQVNGGKKAFGIEECEALEFLEKKDDYI